MDNELLSETDADLRYEILANLRLALKGRGLECVLAGRQRVVLSYTKAVSGPLQCPKNPALYVFVPDVNRPVKIETEGTVYLLPGSKPMPLDDLDAVASEVAGYQRANAGVTPARTVRRQRLSPATSG